MSIAGSTVAAQAAAAYPVQPDEGLSRRLVPVKSWLLALPQICVVAIFSGGFPG